jgi:hypothetical protein
MSSSINYLRPILLLVAVTLFAPACSAPSAISVTDQASGLIDSSAMDLDLITVEENGGTNLQGDHLAATLQSTDVTSISETEAAALQFMREEEKLAHDLYLALFDLWGTPIFNNIASSEATHTEAVRQLLEKYEIEDPAFDNTLGIFLNPDLQDLYDQLLDRGSQSLEEALLVGALLEEVDIQDLEDRIGQTNKTLIQQVYANLIAGSKNHLRAFAGQYQSRTGEPYSAQHLDPNEVQDILTSAIERGRRGRSN